MMACVGEKSMSTGRCQLVTDLLRVPRSIDSPSGPNQVYTYASAAAQDHRFAVGGRPDS